MTTLVASEQWSLLHPLLSSPQLCPTFHAAHVLLYNSNQKTASGTNPALCEACLQSSQLLKTQKKVVEYVLGMRLLLLTLDLYLFKNVMKMSWRSRRLFSYIIFVRHHCENSGHSWWSCEFCCQWFKSSSKSLAVPQQLLQHASVVHWCHNFPSKGPKYERNSPFPCIFSQMKNVSLFSLPR